METPSNGNVSESDTSVKKVLKKRHDELTLWNKGQLSLYPLGTGGAFGKKLYQNNYILIKGKDHLFIDFGTRASQALVEKGLKVTDIHNLLITHSHADHVGGVEEIILMGRYVAKRKPRIFITPEYERMLWSNTLKGGAAYNERHGNTLLHFQDFFEVVHPEPVKTLDRDAWQFSLGAMKVVMFRTMHYPDSSKSWKDSAYSVGLIIDNRVLFTGDTRFDPDLIHSAVKNYPIEAVFHDVQFYPGGVHAAFDQIKTLPTEIKKMTYLMHYPDTFQEKVSEVQQAGFAGFVEQHCYYDFE